MPLVRDSDRRPHAPALWTALAKELLERFDGFTGPEGPVPGNYRGRSGAWIQDASRRFTVALPRGRVGELRRLLQQVANAFDQECIYFAVGDEVELVDGDASAGHIGER